MTKNVFKGREALKNFLKPDKENYSPLLELPEDLNPFHHEKIRIFIKLLSSLPLHNVKSIPAYNMIEASVLSGKKLSDSQIESSSGNTVSSLAIIGREFGIKNTFAHVSNEVSLGKLQALRFFGVNPIVLKDPICPDPTDPESSMYKTRKLAKEKEWLNFDQYKNIKNPEAHESYTGPQIWSQTEGNVQIFCSGLGTTGTFLGTSNFLKNKNEKVVCVGVTRAPNNDIPGVRTINQLKEIDFKWDKSCDKQVTAGTKDSFLRSLEMCRRGIVAGPSSGFCLQGLLNYLNSLTKDDKDALRNSQGEINCVCIACDLPYLYLDDYFTYLDEKYFPEVKNAELLVKAESPLEKKDMVSVPEISVFEVLNLLENSEIVLLDVRSREEWEEFHIEGSLNLPLPDLQENPDKYLERFKDKLVIAICKSGNRSNTASQILMSKNIFVKNMTGGMTEWSLQNFPRKKHNNCVLCGFGKIQNVNTDELLLHEEINIENLFALTSLLRKSNRIKPLLVDEKTKTILDGHHRYCACKIFGLKSIPCLLVDYLNDERIRLESWREDLKPSKKEVLDKALNRSKFPPKTTKHVFPEYASLGEVESKFDI